MKNELDGDDRWSEIASADDDVSNELLDWSGLESIWDKYCLSDYKSFQDLAETAEHISISCESWGGDSPGISGVWKTAATDNESALKKELRDLVAELIWIHRAEIHDYRKKDTAES